VCGTVTAVAAHVFVPTGTTRRATKITGVVAGVMAVPVPSWSRHVLSTQLVDLMIQPRDFVTQLVEQSDHFLGRTAAGETVRRASVAGAARPEVTRTVATGAAWPSAHFPRRTAPRVVGTAAALPPPARWPAKSRTIAAVWVGAGVAGIISVARLVSDVVIVSGRLVTEIRRCRDFALVVKRLVFVVISPERRGERSDAQSKARQNCHAQNIPTMKVTATSCNLQTMLTQSHCVLL
jgi:hypothetical protein